MKHHRVSPWSWLPALTLSLVAAGGAGCKTAGGEGAAEENPMLDDVLSASTDRAFQEALRKHGRIQAEEIPALRQAAEGWSEKRRRNAVTALSLMDNPEALAILRERAAETDDLTEWATAMRTLLDEPGAEEIAASRPEMVTRAMKADDGFVKGVGFTAALRAGREDAIASLEEQLANPKREGLFVLTDAVNHLEPGAFEARLRALYDKEPPGVMADALATALAKGKDPESGALVRARYLALDPNRRMGTLRAIQLGTAPWARPLLLELATMKIPERTAVIQILINQGPAADWMRMCVDIFEGTPPRDPNDPVWADYNTLQEPCRAWASKEAGQPQDAEATLARLRAWLAANEPGTP